MAKHTATKQIQKSIARPLILVTVLFSVMVTLLATGGQLYFNYKNDVGVIQSRIEQIRSSHLNSLVASIWSFDGKLTQILLDGFLRMPDIEYLSINKNGEEMWHAGELVSEDIISVEIPLEYLSQGQYVRVGDLRVVASLDAVYGRLIETGLTILLIVGSLIFIVTGFLFFIVQHLITRHLTSLARYTETISLDRDAPSLVLDRRAMTSEAADEFDQISEAINSMRVELMTSVGDLRSSEERFKDFAEVSSDWFWEMDENLKFTFFSERYDEVTSFDPKDRIGTSRQDFVPKEDREANPEKWEKHLADLGARRTFSNFEYATDASTTGRRHVMISGKPIFNDEGAFVGYRGTGTNISERKSLESQLRQTHRMEAVGQLTGGVAHDFNNLLGIMLGNAEIVEIHAGDVEKTKYNIKVMKETVDRAASLTNRLLSFSRQQALSPASADIADLVKGLDDMLKRTLGETIALNIDVGKDVWPAIIDHYQFENALVNLAINARDAMPNGGSMTIEAANTTLDETYTEQHDDVAPGDYVTVAVSDTGSGMTPEILDRVFEPFFTTKDVGKGSGLGLSMVFGFAKQSGGHITIYSEVGLGTTVKLYMPRSKEGAIQNGFKEETPEFTEGVGRILVVEDDEDLRRIPVSVLRDQGYEVVEAENGEEAIKVLSQDTVINMLFSDVILPGGMNGVEIAEQAVQLQPNIKVLYASGYAQSAIMHDGKLVAGVNLLNKPYSRVALLEKVQAMLDINGD